MHLNEPAAHPSITSPGPLVTRREALKRILLYGAAASQAGFLLSACDPPEVPDVGWHPSISRPVFYGHQDLDTDSGAPGPLRVFYPSTDGAPDHAPFLEGGPRYPLVAFLHGHCNDSNQYRHWFLMGAQLARCGYVVVAPRLPFIVSGGHPQGDETDLPLVRQVLEWVRNDWEHAARVQPTRAAVAGHSYGALLGGRLVSETPADFRAYVSLSGVWQDWNVAPHPLGRISVPSMLTWGSIDDIGEVPAVLDEQNAFLFDAVARPKHRVVFDGGFHWDYLPPNQTTCEGGTGPCSLVDNLAADLTAAFVSKNMPPPGFVGSNIADGLTLPEVELTPDQQFFIGGHLSGLLAIENAPSGCNATISWFTNSEGSRTLPP